MHPEFITIGGRPIYWYGVMMALAFISGILLWRHMGQQTGRGKDFGSDLALWVLLPGIAGARLLYVLANFPYYRAVPSEIWRIDQGGLIFYGGLLGGALGAIVFSIRRRERLPALLDFLIVAIPLGHMFGRIGCFLNGCCYGIPVSGDEGHALHNVITCGGGVAMAGDPISRYPVQLFEAAGNFFIFLILYALYRRQTRQGLISAAYLALYPGLRFGLEFLRGDDRWRSSGLTAAQWLSLSLIAIAILLALYAYQSAKTGFAPNPEVGNAQRPTPDT